MFTPKALNNSRSKYSPFTANRELGSGRTAKRSSNIYTPSLSSKRTPLTSRQRNVSGTPQTGSEDRPQFETYGGPLPVLVTEVIALSDRGEDASVKIDPSGWAWLVYGRKLLIWKLTISQNARGTQCKELLLPPSVHKYTANMVGVFSSTGDNMACVAVSREGAIRYWANIAHDGSYADVTAEAKGEDCVALIMLECYSCVMATSSSTLFLISPQRGQNQVYCKVLRAPSGMLGGIGRRMSSLIFGSVATQAFGAPLHQILPGEMLDDEVQAFYVLSGSSLQKWSIVGETERLLFQCNMQKLFADYVSENVWGENAAHLPNLKTWFLDMQMTRDGVIILGAAINPDVSNRLSYALGTLHTDGSDPPQSFLSFTVPRYTMPYQEEDEPQLLGIKLLLPDSTSSSGFLHDKHSVVDVSVSNSEQDCFIVNFSKPGEKLIGAGEVDNLAVFFSTQLGLFSYRKTSEAVDLPMTETFMDQSASRLDTTVGSFTPARIAELSISEDQTQRLKAAFLQSCHKNMREAQAIVDDLFPPGMAPSSEPGSLLDSLVVKLSQEMTDEYPASDPRWAESGRFDGGSSTTSLILIHQLEDKLKAHDLFVQFLKNIGLFDRLSTLIVRDTVMSTRDLLREHAEKLVAAKALREVHTRYPEVVDSAIKIVLENRPDAVCHSGLTPQDVFYREASKIQDVIGCLIDWEDECLEQDSSPKNTVSTIHTINAIFGGMLSEAWVLRQTKALTYAGQALVPQPEYIPWTSTQGPRGIRDLLIKQHQYTAEQAIQLAEDDKERDDLFQQLLELTDMILDGYKSQLESVKHMAGESSHYLELLRKFEQQRVALIEPFMEHNKFEKAGSLAEKYCEFKVLIRVCEETNNQDRLHLYMNKFQSRGFAEIVFKWYVDEGKRGKLMTSSLASHPQLSRFLKSGENKYMSWLHDINGNDFYQAHKTLLDLGLDEKDSLSKKKTMLSISKLAALAADDPPDDIHSNIEAINAEHDVVVTQERLPGEVLENLGIDRDNMKVMSPKEIIQTLVSDMNTAANEEDFKMALDMMQNIEKDDPEYKPYLLHLWSQAILRDEWVDINIDDPLDTRLSDTVFFKTVERAYAEGYNLRDTDYLPTPPDLLGCNELGTLATDSSFQYLLKAGYEKINRILS